MHLSMPCLGGERGVGEVGGACLQWVIDIKGSGFFYDAS